MAALSVFPALYFKVRLFLRLSSIDSVYPEPEGYDKGLERDGVGYGDSYILDPLGEIVARSQRHAGYVIFSIINPEFPAAGNRLLKSCAELGEMLRFSSGQRGSLNIYHFIIGAQGVT